MRIFDQADEEQVWALETGWGKENVFDILPQRALYFLLGRAVWMPVPDGRLSQQGKGASEL